MEGTANLHSRDYGRLFIDYKELKDSNCMAEIISFNDGIIYTSKQSEIPSTALIKFEDSLERVATFPLLQKENICNYQCYSTSYEELFICTENLNNTLIKKTNDPNLLKSIKISLTHILQLNVQESIEKILMTICQQNRKIILNAMTNPNTFANLIDPLADKNQFQIIDRGVSTSVFRCKERVLFPQTTKHCCKNLPIL